MEIERFRQYLAEKKKALKDYLALSESMRKSLHQSDLEEILRWIEMRQELIGRINRLDDDTRQAFGFPSFSTGEWPESIRQEILIGFREMEEVLNVVKQIDHECQQQMALRRNGVQSERERLAQEVKTARSYMRGLDHSPRFLDIRR